MTLTYSEDEDGVLEICLNFSGKQGICAFMATLSYQSENFLFLGSESAIESSVISCRDDYGRLNFLIDGICNSEPECTLARFYFKRLGECGGEFFLKDVFDGAALYIDNGTICRSDVKTEGCAVEAIEKKAPAEQEPCPRILFADISHSGDSGRIAFSLSVPETCFAAGVKLFILNTESGETREVYIIGISARGKVFERECRVDIDEMCSVVITAVGYAANEEIKGEKIVIVLNNKTPS